MTRNLAGRQVNPIGLGCMSLSGSYGDADDDASVELIRTAIDNAKAVSMPKDNIERAIKKGAGLTGGRDGHHRSGRCLHRRGGRLRR